MENGTTNGETEEIEEALEALEIIPVAPAEIPSPHPPSCRKKDLYVDPSQFNDIDEQTIKVCKSGHFPGNVIVTRTHVHVAG